MDSNTGTRRSVRRRRTPPELNDFEVGTRATHTGARQNTVTQSQSQSQSQSRSQNRRRRGSEVNNSTSQRRRLENNRSELSAEENVEATSIRTKCQIKPSGCGDIQR